MKCAIPEISWHNREPVLSVDLHPNNEKFYRLATGGADCHVLIWQLNINDNGALTIDPLSDLTRHQRAVNAVRWSPNGQYLASADDDANIIVWHLKTDNIPLLEGETCDKEIWIIHKIMRGHKEDIYDLCWAPSSLKLLSGSIDNTAILWDLNKGRSDLILSDHKGFVQGVAWDPKGQYIATISTDRMCRIFESTGKQIKARIHKGNLPVPKSHYLSEKEVKYFHDDTFKSFYRRLDFSPDGSLIAVPSGHIEHEDCKTVLNGAYLFMVESWTEPVALLPSGKQCTTVARFCPILYELQDDGPDALVSLPYRMILAIGTDRDVILYDTQQQAPFAYFHNINYTRITDLTWSKDGQFLIASSTDGFCALITFEVNELGIQYVKEDSEAEESILNVSGCVEIDETPAEPPKEEKEKPKRPSFLEKWTIKTPKKTNNTESSDSNNENKESPKHSRTESLPATENTAKDAKENEVKKPRRVQLIPVKLEKWAVKTPKKSEDTQSTDKKNENISDNENKETPKENVAQPVTKSSNENVNNSNEVKKPRRVQLIPVKL